MLISTLYLGYQQFEGFTKKFKRLLRKYHKRFILYKKLAYAKSQAQSLNHLTILLQKCVLNLPIEKGESEMKSYIEIKQHFKDSWPFMWRVKNVKDLKIDVCSKFKCEPFQSYSYLNLIRDEGIQKAAIEAAQAYASGNHGPRMLGGNTEILEQLEEEISKFLGKQRTITCSSGYLACMSAVAALAKKGDVIIADQFCHASLKSGFRLSYADIITFKHNNFDDCERKIKKLNKKQKKIMVIESVYSMDGNIGNLPRARELCDKYNILLIVDEAHGLGALGKTGKGLQEYYNMPGAPDVIVGTFSKSFASVGGFISGSDEVIQYMEFFAQGNMFSAPLSAYHAGAALAAFKKIQNEPILVEKLHNNVDYFRQKIQNIQWKQDLPFEMKCQLYGVSGQPILPIVFLDDPLRVFEICKRFKENGFLTGAVVAPACPLRTPRLRITTNTDMTKESIDRFVQVLQNLCETIPVNKLLNDDEDND